MDTPDDVLRYLRANDAPRPELLVALVEPCLVLTTRPNVTGRTRLGGLPDLPEHRSWPTTSRGEPMMFLGQLDLADLAETRIANALPARGLLGWYFSDLDGSGPPELAITLVDEPATRRSTPGEVLPERGVAFQPSWSLPPVHSPRIADLALTDDELASWGEIVESWIGPEGHQLLGYDHGSDAYLSCAIDTDELLRTAYFERYKRDPRETTHRPFADPDLAARARAFRLLIEFADDPEVGFVWGDGAPTTFLVHQDVWGTFDVASPTSLATVRCDRS